MALRRLYDGVCMMILFSLLFRSDYTVSQSLWATLPSSNASIISPQLEMELTA